MNDNEETEGKWQEEKDNPFVFFPNRVFGPDLCRFIEFIHLLFEQHCQDGDSCLRGDLFHQKCAT